MNGHLWCYNDGTRPLFICFLVQTLITPTLGVEYTNVYRNLNICLVSYSSIKEVSTGILITDIMPPMVAEWSMTAMFANSSRKLVLLRPRFKSCLGHGTVYFTWWWWLNVFRGCYGFDLFGIWLLFHYSVITSAGINSVKLHVIFLCSKIEDPELIPKQWKFKPNKNHSKEYAKTLLI